MLRNKFMQFMYGRSGSDQLGLFCLITAMVLNLAGSLLAHLSAALYAILTVDDISYVLAQRGEAQSGKCVFYENVE